MKYDVVVGNPPFQAKVDNNTIGSKKSIYPQFFKLAIQDLKPNGLAAIVSPSAMSLKNSNGWRAMSQANVLEIRPNIQDDFEVGTHISYYVFQNSEPTDTYTLCGLEVDSSKTPVIPAKPDPTIISIFQKLQSFDKLWPKWNRDMWVDFEPKVTPNTVAMSRLDRFKYWKLQQFDELNERNLKKCLMLYVETDHPKELIRLFNSKLFGAYRRNVNFAAQINISTLDHLTYPKGWQNLETDEAIYEAYGLTTEEIEYVENLY